MEEVIVQTEEILRLGQRHARLGLAARLVARPEPAGKDRGARGAASEDRGPASGARGSADPPRPLFTEWRGEGPLAAPSL